MNTSGSTKAVDLKPCPFCGAGETISEPDSKVWAGMEWRILSWRIRHWCSDKTHGSLLTVKGKDQQEAEERWNRRLAPEPAARLEYQPGSLTEEEIAGGADIPNCLRCGRTLFGGHSHDSRWYCSSETKEGSES